VALRYVIKARAQREISRLAEWWAANRTAAPGAVRLDLESVLFVLTHHPGLGQEVETGRPVPIRRYLMSRTQHWLYFRVRGSLLEVLSVWATSRETGPRF
jgi:plasmid stabilization system protein ParE